MKQENLIEEFRKLGITEVGIVSANDAETVISENDTVFSYRDRIESISHIILDAKSVIVFLVPYNHGFEPVNISLYATGQDYHKVCKTISDKISQKLANAGHTSVSFADTGPLNERKLACLAGLGIAGDNGFLINEKYGSYTFIGYIITSCKLTASKPKIGKCNQCGKCIRSCPGGALTQGGFVEERCLSYLTQKKGELTGAEKKLIKAGGCAWGCDVCQKVCPMNKDKQLSELKEFNENLILCIKNEYLSNREFKKKYSDRAYSWRGKSVIDRNLSILNDKQD